MADENINPNQNPPSPDRSVSYQVMPQSNGRPKNMLNTPPPPPPQMPGSANLPMVEPKKSNLWVYVVISVVVVLILGGLAYYFLGGFGTSETPSQNVPVSRLNSTFLSQYFGSATCSDQATC
jgi:hypothetical protein